MAGYPDAKAVPFFPEIDPVFRVTDPAAQFAGDEAKFAGWVEVQWARPTGAALDKIVEQLKALKLTMRNSPIGAAPADGACFFTGDPAVERILIGRTY